MHFRKFSENMMKLYAAIISVAAITAIPTQSPNPNHCIQSFLLSSFYTSSCLFLPFLLGSIFSSLLSVSLKAIFSFSAFTSRGIRFHLSSPSLILATTFHNNIIVAIFLGFYNNTLRISSFPKWFNTIIASNNFICWIWCIYIEAIFK